MSEKEHSTMGEAARKSLSRQQIIFSEPRCIYCPGPVETVEHMPPISMFRDRQRPRQMEFASCRACNNETRGSDAVATVMALVHPDHVEESWQNKKLRGLRSTINMYAPGVLEEMGRPGKSADRWIKRDGIFRRVIYLHADGPLVKAHLSIFGAKLGMALYREHVGVALPLDGAVWCQFALNAGMTQEHLDARVEILPLFQTLRQGRANVQDQFVYRYNCDNRTVIAAVVQFHRGLWYTLVATSDQRIIDLFNTPASLQVPASALIRPGELRQVLAGPLVLADGTHPIA